MSFLYPLGLLGLIGIPIVIIIYILRSKYNEQTVTSTYIWKLSEKFLKRKNPLSGLTGIISLVLQILTIAAISLAVARPIFVLPGAAYDYCFILDASGSMNMKNGKQTRFEIGKEEIVDRIKSAAGGSTYTLVSVSDEAVTVFENVSDKKAAVEAVESVSETYASYAYSEILGEAQKRFDANSSLQLYLVTDKNYAQYENIEIIDVSAEDEENYAIFDVQYTQAGGKLKVWGDVISYKNDTELEVKLYVDDAKEPSATTTVSAKAGERTDVTLECRNLKFTSFRTEISNSDIYLADNSVTTHNLRIDKTYDTLIVSETGFFLEAVLDALLDSRVTIVDPDEYGNVTESYGLYIFDCYTPSELPDASVWLINSDLNIENSGFGVKTKVDCGEPTAIKKSTLTATGVQELLEDVDGTNVYIANYVKYKFNNDGNFSTLFTCEGNPVIFAGANGTGNRQVVFGFDLHESDLPLSADFVLLARNLLEHSFPDVIERTNYTVGEEAIVNIVANAENIKAESPSGEELYMESDGIYATLGLTEIGTYTIHMDIAGVATTYKIYAGADPDESDPNETGGEFSLSGERGYEKRDGEYDPLTVLFVCLALLFIADWGVYCYEKYQLR